MSWVVLTTWGGGRVLFSYVEDDNIDNDINNNKNNNDYNTKDVNPFIFLKN